jgi:hypothetical protein
VEILAVVHKNRRVKKVVTTSITKGMLRKQNDFVLEVIFHDSQRKKKLSYDQSVQIIRDWLLNKCEPVNHLKFNVEYKIKEALRNSQQSKIFHMLFDNLAESKPELYRQLKEEHVHLC